MIFTSIARTLHSMVPFSAVKASARVFMAVRRLDCNHFLNIHLETCAQCNRRCHYCPQSKDPFGVKWMDDEVIEIALRRMQAIRWDGPIILCVFNEPLLDKRLLDIVSKCRSIVPRAFPQIFSNGDLLTSDIANELVSAGLKSCVITPHPPYKDGWTQRIDDIRSKWPSVFKVNGGVTPYRVGGLNKLPENRKTSCDYQDWSFVIRHDGTVPLCCIDYKPETGFGNIRTSGIYDIWYSREFSECRRMLRNGKYKHGVCSDCFNNK